MESLLYYLAHFYLRSKEVHSFFGVDTGVGGECCGLVQYLLFSYWIFNWRGRAELGGGNLVSKQDPLGSETDQ